MLLFRRNFYNTSFHFKFIIFSNDFDLLIAGHNTRRINTWKPLPIDAIEIRSSNLLIPAQSMQFDEYYLLLAILSRFWNWYGCASIWSCNFTKFYKWSYCWRVDNWMQWIYIVQRMTARHLPSSRSPHRHRGSFEWTYIFKLYRYILTKKRI